MKSESPILQSRLADWLSRRTLPSGTRRVASVAAAVASEIGSVRDENQDRAVVARFAGAKGCSCVVLAVADGIGGMRDGANCASLAISSFLAALYARSQSSSDVESWLGRAAADANSAVFDRYDGFGGSTLVALVVRGNQPTFWLSIGDSRVYRSNVHLRNLQQLSVDDTIAGQLQIGLRGELEQSQLLQFVGMGKHLEPNIDRLAVEISGSVLLTTDGVHFLDAPDGVLGSVVNNAPDPGACVKRLVELAKWCGGPDNATAAMIDLSPKSEAEQEVPSGCLEIWDAFGELQVIESAMSLAFDDRDQKISTRQYLTGSERPVLEKNAAGESSSYSQPKTRRARLNKDGLQQKNTPRKSYRGRNKPTEGGTPELLMVFPKSSN